MGKLILPHPGSLRKLSTVFNVNPGVEGVEHAKYLKYRASQLTEKQRYVVLQLDEIHVNASLAFKSGCITGAAVNAEQTLAHSVQGFMISSMFGNAKEVVALCPVKDLTATDLLVMLKKVLYLVQTNGFVVVCVIADNNQLNAKAFADFARNQSFEQGVANPHYPGSLIFFMFDSVHILMCIRNNWLNQTDKQQTFSYPQITKELKKCSRFVNNCPGQLAQVDADAAIQNESQSALPENIVFTLPDKAPPPMQQQQQQRLGIQLLQVQPLTLYLHLCPMAFRVLSCPYPAYFTYQVCNKLPMYCHMGHLNQKAKLHLVV